MLPTDRDFIFEPKSLDSLSVYIYIIDYSISQIFIRNDTDKNIVLPRNIRVGSVAEYDLVGCFAVNPE